MNNLKNYKQIISNTKFIYIGDKTYEYLQGK